MNDEFRYMVIEALRRGEDLPVEWARILFPPEKREYELVYYGKEREEDILAATLAVPLQPVRVFGESNGNWHNKIIFGDNLQAIKTLLEQKKEGTLCNADGTPGARLIYIDPPFATSKEFRGNQEQKAYQDKIVGAAFVEFLRKRLIILRELLSENGALVVHLDTRKGHYIKVILDEIFGEHNFRNAIVWKRSDAHSDVSQGATHLGRVYDTLFYYVRSSNTKINPVYTPLPQSTVDKWYRHVEEETGRRYNMGDASGPGGARKGNPYYEWNGIKRYWRFSKERMQELENEGRLAYSSSGIAYIKRYLDESKGVPIQDWWDDIPMLRGIHKRNESTSYPTQKPEQLLERVVLSLSDPGDLVIDAFAGSGTTSAVAEKLGRRWVAIDSGKLAIYTIQKRMLNLKTEIGQKGEPMRPNPFVLYNAGLYDFSTLRQLPWANWRFFALQLFGCKDEPHTIGGLQLDGKRQGASVLVFNHIAHHGRRIDARTVADIHAAIGQRIGHKFFIIAPRNTFDFQQDYLDLDGVRYYALRIPYSFINELHHREFTALEQPKDETAVNETIDAYGFDFIRPPQVKWTLNCEKPKKKGEQVPCLRIESFHSRAYIQGKDRQGSLETLSMVMLDYDYDGDVFDLDAVIYAQDLLKADWRIWFPVKKLGEQVMIVFIDIYGNEARELIPRTRFDELTRKASRQKEATG